MDFQLPPEKMETVLRLCDILSLQDLALAGAILDSCQWNLEKAINMMEQGNKKNPPAPPPVQINEPYDYEDAEFQQQYDSNEYEYAFSKQTDLQNKKKMFQNQYVSFPLSKTTSQTPNQLEKRLSYDRLLKEDFSFHRKQYQSNLLKNSQALCDRILSSKSQQVQRFYKNKRKNENNKEFLLYLHKKYKTKINFTFGTFLLNLTRSYLDKKYLLVYIHKSQFQENHSIEMLLQQKEISNFVNKNCISYGMFDSSDDYEIVQKYVPMKNLPAFALFKFDKKGQKQHFIDQYVILKKDQVDFIQWIAPLVGVSIKKKEAPVQKKQQNKMEEFTSTLTDIVNSQNNEYEEMQRLYKLKRQQSQIKKSEISLFQEKLEKAKQKYSKQQQIEPQNAIQIKFRLPMTGKSLVYTFTRKDKIIELFEYIHCFGRDQFQDKYADFDLTQTFPRLSLVDKKQTVIDQVFEGSDRENIIVKQL